MGKFIDLTGQRFGRLTVLEYAGYQKGVMWKCRCDCGQEKIVRSDHLRYGKTVSCGCYRNTVSVKVTGEKIRKHGMWNTRLYHIWIHMKQRCSPSCPKHEYHRYYGRGIRVCAEWVSDFSAFEKWAVENGYSDGLSIDRIDNNGNYEPANCRWADAEAQANNRSTSTFIAYNGETLTIAQWAKRLNIKPSTLKTALSRGKKFESIAKKKGL